MNEREWYANNIVIFNLLESSSRFKIVSKPELNTILTCLWPFSRTRMPNFSTNGIKHGINNGKNHSRWRTLKNLSESAPKTCVKLVGKPTKTPQNLHVTDTLYHCEYS